MPCIRPPWGQLMAVNANTGEILWKSVLGLRLNMPEGKQLLGNSGSAGPTVTAGGLVFVGATNDGRFRAFDAKTGKPLWESRRQPASVRPPVGPGCCSRTPDDRKHLATTTFSPLPKSPPISVDLMCPYS